MAVGFSNTNKPINPRGADASPKGYNRAALYSGKALSFDGVNDYVDISNFSMSGQNGSFCFYYEQDSNSVFRYAFDMIPTTGVRVAIVIDSGQLKFLINNEALANQGEILNGEPNFCVITSEGTTQNFYINGQFIASQTSATFISLGTTGDAAIGSRRDGAAAFLDGQIAGFKIFNTALTAAQVADLYNNPEKVVPTGVDNTALKLWLPMQEGAGTTAYDGSGNGNHGTISGATYTHGIGAPVSQTAVIDWNKSHNYIDKSEEFETASWTENRLVTITDDSFIAPDGSATATEIVETTDNDTHFLAQTLSVTAGDYFISAYVKKRDYDWVQLSTGGDTTRYANFNISTGATGNASGISDLVIQDKGNGWYRIGGKLTTSSTSFNYFITLIQSDVASRFQTYTGTDKGQYIWGAQATKSATLQPYLRNIGTSAITDDVLLPQGLTSGRDITGVNLFENVRKQGALNLDGNSWAEVHDNASLDITDAITLEAWVQNSDELNSVYDHIFVKPTSTTWTSPYGTYVLRLRENDVQWWFESVANAKSHSVSLSGWNHLIVTKNGSSEILYINGVQVDTNTGSATMSSTIYNLLIGTRTQYSTNEMIANQLAQPRIYNRALTAAEVLQNYNSGKNIYK